jgi:hypothetical protein
MKNIIKHIAVLATAALMVATSFAADNYSPGNISNHVAVAINPNTGVLVYPTSYFQLIGFNGDITNSLAPTLAGTNFIINPKNGPYQYMAVTNPVNISHATNVVAGTAWELKLLVNPGTVDRALTLPSTWNWATNKFDTNGVTRKLTTLGSNTLCEFTIKAIGTNVLIRGQEYRP